MKADTGKVALRKESVDRNLYTVQIVIIIVKSLSARRAWIEMSLLIYRQKYGIVSLSARRAWIEMSGMACKETGITPSLSARRAWIEISMLCSVVKY